MNKILVIELARCDSITQNEKNIAVGNSGTGKTHIALGLGLATCQNGLAVGFITASALVHERLEARDEKRLLRLQKKLRKYSLLIIPSQACTHALPGSGCTAIANRSGPAPSALNASQALFLIDCLTMFTSWK